MPIWRANVILRLFRYNQNNGKYFAALRLVLKAQRYITILLLRILPIKETLFII